MKRKVLTIVMTIVLTALGTFSMLAVDEPTVTNDAIVYVSYNSGNNEYSGKSADEAKRQLLTLDDNAAVAMLRDGGTMIASGKIYIGGTYAFPVLGSTVKITANDGTTDFKNEIPLENPASGVLKMASGAVLTLASDFIIDDMILFQENAMNTIKVTNNSTLVIGDKIVCKNNINSLNPVYMAIEVEAGSTVILNGGIFQQITGEGTIINNGATIVADAQPEDTTDAVVTSDAVPVTSEDTPAAVSTSDATSAATESTEATTEATKATTDTTKATTEATKKETTAKTDPATSPDTAPSTTGAVSDAESGNTGLMIGIIAVAAVIVVVAIVVVIKKKKK